MSWCCWTVDDELVLLNVCWWLVLLNYCWWDGVVQNILMSSAWGIPGTHGAEVTELLMVKYWWSIELMLMNSCDELMSFISGWYTLVSELMVMSCGFWNGDDGMMLLKCGDELMNFWWRYANNELMSRDGVGELIFLNGWWWDSVVLGLLNWDCWTGITELLVIILCCRNYVEYLCCWTAMAQMMFLSCCRWAAVSNLTWVIWYC